ncbi:TIGR03089 family protein [Sinomonas sp. P10A9]|uniref:TIGR03089 family protein n=1 Tax=Sinomonas puerhi TaxID=3238584 RepID=A0AB39L8W1_9MICC
MASTIPDLLKQLRSGNHSSSPRLTWYGPGGERIELSGRVLDNWVAKTANFLSEELDAERGTRIRLDLPAHWKSAVVALAAWQVGAVLLAGSDQGPADITFIGPDGTHDAAPAPGGEVTGGEVTGGEVSGTGVAGARVAVALGALEMRFPGTLAAGTYDYAALVRQFADSYEPFDPPVQEDEALRTGGTALTQADLLGRFAAAEADGARILVSAGQGLIGAVARMLGAWAAGGSVVLVHESVEETDTERIRAAEKTSPAEKIS